MTPSFDLLAAAKKAYPYSSYINRRTTQRLRLKCITALKYMGTKYILHPANKKERLC